MSRVRLMLPETHRWIRFDGSMGQVDERGEYVGQAATFADWQPVS